MPLYKQYIIVALVGLLVSRSADAGGYVRPAAEAVPAKPASKPGYSAPVSKYESPSIAAEPTGEDNEDIPLEAVPEAAPFAKDVDEAEDVPAIDPEDKDGPAEYDPTETPVDQAEAEVISETATDSNEAAPSEPVVADEDGQAPAEGEQESNDIPSTEADDSTGERREAARKVFSKVASKYKTDDDSTPRPEPEESDIPDEKTEESSGDATPIPQDSTIPENSEGTSSTSDTTTNSDDDVITSAPEQITDPDPEGESKQASDEPKEKEYVTIPAPDISTSEGGVVEESEKDDVSLPNKRPAYDEALVNTDEKTESKDGEERPESPGVKLEIETQSNAEGMGNDDSASKQRLTTQSNNESTNDEKEELEGKEEKDAQVDYKRPEANAQVGYKRPKAEAQTSGTKPTGDSKPEDKPYMSTVKA